MKKKKKKKKKKREKTVSSTVSVCMKFIIPFILCTFKINHKPFRNYYSHRKPALISAALYCITLLHSHIFKALSVLLTACDGGGGVIEFQIYYISKYNFCWWRPFVG
jgi:hypothetical protein